MHSIYTFTDELINYKATCGNLLLKMKFSNYTFIFSSEIDKRPRKHKSRNTLLTYATNAYAGQIANILCIRVDGGSGCSYSQTGRWRILAYLGPRGSQKRCCVRARSMVHQFSVYLEGKKERLSKSQYKNGNRKRHAKRKIWCVPKGRKDKEKRS